ncbi:hypothetical protein QR680_007338 [Steinernema hermaphroditum]|uniref:Uncharacterized protein n=1 Tax=Steinernema hermaphroditum TaxID=289476 RepID=A0AA39M585_9BILA|nr:hypothetical protein QR680_007338 [Steinernema hermaphroditum]
MSVAGLWGAAGWRALDARERSGSGRRFSGIREGQSGIATPQRDLFLRRSSSCEARRRRRQRSSSKRSREYRSARPTARRFVLNELRKKEKKAEGEGCAAPANPVWRLAGFWFAAEGKTKRRSRRYHWNQASPRHPNPRKSSSPIPRRPPFVDGG